VVVKGPHAVLRRDVGPWEIGCDKSTIAIACKDPSINQYKTKREIYSQVGVRRMRVLEVN